LWGSWIMLGEDFYKAITSSTVPCDMRALRALKRSPLALDLYALAIHKAFMANRRNTEEFIPWIGLLMQLGADYDPKRIDKFKTKVKTTLRKVAAVFPVRPGTAGALKYKWDRNGLCFLSGTKLPIAPESGKNSVATA
jgi:Plasmid encoded RepA protein